MRLKGVGVVEDKVLRNAAWARPDERGLPHVEGDSQLLQSSRVKLRPSVSLSPGPPPSRTCLRLWRKGHADQEVVLRRRALVAGARGPARPCRLSVRG